MSKPIADARPDAKDPSFKPGLRSPVRDKAKLGDAQYGVTPPREKVKSPQHSGAATTCSECNAQLDEAHPYRADAEEYAYHFCDAGCHERWQSKQSNRNDPRVPK